MNKQSFYQSFFTLLKDSTLVQASVTLILVIAITYMYLSSMDVPPELINIIMLILGFYFGGKSQAKIEGMARNAKKHYYNNPD